MPFQLFEPIGKGICAPCTYRMLRNIFFHHSLQPLPRLHRCKRPALNGIREYRHSYWLLILFVQPIEARERWQTFENSRKKHTIFNEHPVYLTKEVSCASRTRLWPWKQRKSFELLYVLTLIYLILGMNIFLYDILISWSIQQSVVIIYCRFQKLIYDTISTSKGRR